MSMQCARAMRRMKVSLAASARRPAVLSVAVPRARFQSTRGPAGALHDEYKRRVDGGLITYDPVQARAVHHLDVLYAELLQYGGPSTATSSSSAAAASAASAGKSWWQKLTSGGDADEASANVLETRAPRGLYLHGGVGCGKVGVLTAPVSHRPDSC